MRSFFSYYRRVFARALRSGATWGRDQVIGFLIAIAVLVMQHRFGLLAGSQLGANLWSILWPYVLLFGLFVGFLLLRAPWQLDRDKESEIGILKGKVSIGASRDAVAKLMRTAQALSRESPAISATREEIEAWKGRFRDWLNSAARHFEEGSEAELAIFLDDSNVKDCWFPHSHPDVQMDRLTLDVRVRNLKVILGPFS